MSHPGSYLRIPILTAALFSVACTSGPKKAPVLAEAFAGPMELPLRRDISMKSPVVATALHGDRLDVLHVRRRFIRVRTVDGAEGWTENEKLLGSEQMEKIQTTNELAAKLPSQGEAIVYDLLNIHTAPNRQAPSFHRLKENEKFVVIGHRLEPRVPYTPAISQKAISKAQKAAEPKRRRKKKDEDDGIERPPMPKAPEPPMDWIDISRQVSLPPPDPVEESIKEAKKAKLAERDKVQMEDWTLIRTYTGKAGWVLSRMVAMTIPDEVGQYSEGQRVTSWFPLGEIMAQDGTKKSHYVWTTIPRGGVPYEFDGFRVFIFNVRRNRYETAYRERDLKGYYPAAAHMVEVESGRRKINLHGFTLVVENEDGSFERRTFVLEGYRARQVASSPWRRSTDPLDVRSADITKPPGDAPSQADDKGIWQRIRERLPIFGDNA